MIDAMPFAVALGIQLEAATKDEVRGSVDWAPERCTAGGLLHGGAIMALADSLGGLCAYLNLPDGATTATIESKTNFFRGVRSGAVHAVARPRHVGRTSIVVQTEVTDDDDRSVALVIQTQAILTA